MEKTKRYQFAETYYQDSSLGARINAQLFDLENGPNCRVVLIVPVGASANYVTVIFECDEVEDVEEEGNESEGNEASSSQEDS